MAGRKLFGKHLIVDAWSCSRDLLNDLPYIERAVVEAVSAGGGTLIDICVHQFSPQGVTVNAMLAESHINVHTWPELEYFAADVFFCGKGNPERALESLVAAFAPKQTRISAIERGINRLPNHTYTCKSDSPAAMPAKWDTRDLEEAAGNAIAGLSADSRAENNRSG